MTDKDTTLDTLKSKLKSATKLKLLGERELFKVRDKERSVNEELAMVKVENESLSDQIEEVKTQIAQARYQISMIEICSASEKAKLQAHVTNLESHSKGFQGIFDKESELRLREIQEKEAAEQEILRQKEKEVAERNFEQASEVAALEAECDSLERECMVLKKRNICIMLKLRRKLLDTENARRELMKRNNASEK